MDWIDFWKNRKKSNEKAENGFDSTGSKLNDDGYEFMRTKTCDFLKPFIRGNSNIVEIGCGSAALIARLSNIHGNSKFSGVDISPSLISVAADKLPNVNFYVSSANKLHFDDEKFETTYCFSIFQYFKNLEYAKEVINEMIRITKLNGTIIIMDVPNIDLFEESESKRDKPSEHLFYSKDFFKQFENVEIIDQNIDGYANSPYRFNVIIKKRKLNLSFVEFIAMTESDKFVIEEKNLEWAKQFLSNFQKVFLNETHDGDCTKISSPCPYCVLETLLQNYKEYVFNPRKFINENYCQE